MDRMPETHGREDVMAVRSRTTGMIHYVPKIKGQLSYAFYNRTLCGALYGLHAKDNLVPTLIQDIRITCKRCLKVLAHNEKILGNMPNGSSTIIEDLCELGHFNFSPKLGGKNKTVNILLQKAGILVEDIISITFYKSGPYEQYTVWYRKYKSEIVEDR